MLEFLNSVINYFQQYTLADTTNVFAIVEGAATVVAAVGAIIAVVLTKKIAVEQIEIAKKQNEISDMQANISQQQNNIALLSQRIELIDQVNIFFEEWYVINQLLNGKEDLKIKKWHEKTISVRSRERPHAASEDKNLMEYVYNQPEILQSDCERFEKIRYVFKLDEKCLEFLLPMISKCYELSTMILLNMKLANLSSESIEPIVKGFWEFLDKGREDFLSYLEKQTQIFVNWDT